MNVPISPLCRHCGECEIVAPGWSLCIDCDDNLCSGDKCGVCGLIPTGREAKAHTPEEVAW